MTPARKQSITQFAKTPNQYTKQSQLRPANVKCLHALQWRFLSNVI